jgi:hypothetical protein
MFPAEPIPTAIGLAVVGVLLALSVVLSRTLGRIGVPVVVLFLVLGMLAGSEGIGGIAFDNYLAAFRLGTVALALILFDGGLNTPLAAVKPNAAPSAVLATLGVIGARDHLDADAAGRDHELLRRQGLRRLRRDDGRPAVPGRRGGDAHRARADADRAQGAHPARAW